MGDLCSMLKTSSINDIPGFWEAGKDKRILLTMGPHNQAEGPKHQPTSLEEFLLSTSRRDHRVEQALGVLYNTIPGTFTFDPHRMGQIQNLSTILPTQDHRALFESQFVETRSQRREPSSKARRASQNIHVRHWSVAT
uniref:Uncharacterized protein n=1 Tax=Bionectria ochroleuca TaxID=29856 RepID=A0A8H7NLY3_BIOOC